MDYCAQHIRSLLSFSLKRFNKVLVFFIIYNHLSKLKLRQRVRYMRTQMNRPYSNAEHKIKWNIVKTGLMTH